jgi:hypothetical protein
VFDDSFLLLIVAIRISDMPRVTLQDHFKMTGFVTRLDALVTKYEEISPLLALLTRQDRQARPAYLKPPR